MAIKLLLSGGLGNQLFQYAAARSLALARGTSLIVDLRYYTDAEIGSAKWAWLLDFPIEAEIKAYKSTWRAHGVLPRVLRRIAAPKPYHVPALGFDPHFCEQPDGTVLSGLWQSYRYFADAYPRIAGELDISDRPEVSSNPRIGALALPDSVGIHVRRGDYVDLEGFLLERAAEYYRLAMDEVRERGERAVVFSDDIAWCREQDYFGGAEFYPPSDGPPYIDLYAMSRCKRLVIANSTFSWWAGWFAHQRGAEVTAPHYWLMGRTSKEVDIVPPDWRILDPDPSGEPAC